MATSSVYSVQIFMTRIGWTMYRSGVYLRVWPSWAFSANKVTRSSMLALSNFEYPISPGLSAAAPDCTTAHRETADRLCNSGGLPEAEAVYDKILHDALAKVESPTVLRYKIEVADD